MQTLYGTQDLDIVVGNGAISHAAAAGPLDLAVVDLIKINGPWGRNADYAALIAGVATYDGYAEATITWDTATLDETGAIELIGTVPAFRMTGTVTPNQIFGLVIQNAAKNKMFFNGPVDNAPVTFNGPLSQLVVTIRWKPATNAVTVSLG